MKHSVFAAVVVTAAVVVGAWGVRRASADDETGDTAVKIQAPVDAIDCTGTPPTLTVLGLSIDLSSAKFNPNGDTEVRVRGPLDATNCSATPPTITVLGLVIDVSNAAIDLGDGSPGGCAALTVGSGVEVKLASDSTPLAATEVEGQGEDSGEASVQGPLQMIDTTNKTVQILGLTINAATANSGDDGGQPVDLTQLMVGQFASAQLDGAQLPTLVATSLEVQPIATCAGIMVGDTVEVDLVSDATPLAATVVRNFGSNGWEVSVQGPLQMIDATNNNVQVLGLTINVASANLGGCDDNSEDGNSQPVDLSQLTVGQIVALRLDPNQLPALVAVGLEVKNFANQVSVEVEDSDGMPIDDSTDDITVDATDTTKVQAPSGSGMMKKVVHLHTTSKGSFSLAGLPTGRAKVKITRTANGKTSKKTLHLQIQGNTALPATVKLRTH